MVTVQHSVIASGFCEAISELVVGDCFGTKNRASQ